MPVSEQRLYDLLRQAEADLRNEVLPPIRDLEQQVSDIKARLDRATGGGKAIWAGLAFLAAVAGIIIAILQIQPNVSVSPPPAVVQTVTATPAVAPPEAPPSPTTVRFVETAPRASTGPTGAPQPQPSPTATRSPTPKPLCVAHLVCVKPVRKHHKQPQRAPRWPLVLAGLVGSVAERKRTQPPAS